MRFRIVNLSSDPTTAERIESLKAGTLAAFSLTLAYGAIALGNSLVLAEQFEVLRVLQLTLSVNLLAKVAIAFLSGFLFGVTYRYVIRDDQNPHLQMGVVLAFGLVRGLAPVEVEQNLAPALGSLGVLAMENIIGFAIARLAIDWSIRRHWVKPFTSR